VFAGAAFGGNPVAVVHDADNLSTAQMQRFARWTNLAETTFLLAPTAAEADYRLRIFTPGGELPFAGHPTLGSCRAWLDTKRPSVSSAQVVQECGIGNIPIKVAADQIAFAAPPLSRTGAVDPAALAAITDALGLDAADVVDAAWLDNGIPWIGILTGSAATVLHLQPDFAALGEYCVGVIGPHPAGGPADFEVRAFYPGAPEDPVTGSLNAGLAVWLVNAGVFPSEYVAAQGTALGYTGRIRVSRDGVGALWIGGMTHARIRGEVSF